ncbi:fluoride efflux transporter FluC [Microbacterium sp.]|uniref:fluoride efflux transporter FluC n=1 Tax=Microbacterium sp. TaxID=51671 RepID=UPI002E36EB0D|nr:CrcB family protein [Microbacterium sp.]HEX5729904.1 CrcB family protein [Microbacterium sp.]
MSFWVLVAAAVAGGVGAGLRYLVDVLVVGRAPERFPLGILVVNVSGSFALGALTGIGAQWIADEVAWVVGVGLLGGYTTFSAVSLDSVLLAQGGSGRRAALNAVGTLVLGVGAAALGLALGSLF